MYKKRCRIESSRLFSKDKKGQITIFIILGILLLLALVLVIALQSDIFQFSENEVAPPEKGKVGSFIASCIKDLGEDAIYNIGLQGGYVDVPQSISSDGSQHLRLSPFNVVPYWAYGNNVNMPTLHDLKLRIDQHIENNLRTCLFNLNAFQESYDLVEKDDIVADTNIANNAVIFNVDWDVELREKSGELAGEILKHQARSEIKLKKTYFLASRILEKELENLKIEDLTQDLIALEHPDLPVVGFELSCTQKSWSAAKAQDTLKRLLHKNLGELKIKGTKFEEFSGDLPYYNAHYIWDIGDDINDDKLSVSFQFDKSYPFTFGVTPLSGSNLKSSQLGGTGLIPSLCIQNWKFTYDVIYPVVVRVRDETTGYNFNMAFTVHLIRNQPARGEIEAQPSSTFNTVTSEDFCKTRDLPITVKTFEYVSTDQGVDTREDLGDVNLTFSCLKYSCNLGPTDYNLGGQGFSGLITNFPYCAGGILRGSRVGYKDAWQRVVTVAGKEIELDLIPLYQVPVSRVQILKHEWLSEEEITQAQPMANGERALIKISYKRENEAQASHEETFVLDLDPNSKSQDDFFELLAKADFTYDLDITVLDSDSVIGGYKGNWEVSWDEIQGAKNIVFHVLTKETASVEERAGVLIGLEHNSLFLPKPELQ